MFQARTIARATNYESKFVVKAQVQKSIRSKGFFLENGFKGGIHEVDTSELVRDIADKMCGKTYQATEIEDSLFYNTGT